MGMYDTILYCCPKCDQMIEHQSKGGACQLQNFQPDKVPMDVAASIKGELIYCTGCQRWWEIIVDAPGTVNTRLAQSNGPWRGT